MAVEEKAPPEEEAPPKKKRSLMKLVIVGVLALVVIGGGTGAFLMLRGGAPSEDPATGEGTEDAAATFGPIVELPDFTVNLNEESGRRYLRVKINLELDDDSLKSDVEARLPLIRDSILLLLTDLRLEDINNTEGKEALKENIRTRIDEFLRPGAIRHVLFVEFLVQS
jgi:flagellar FliL protein